MKTLIRQLVGHMPRRWLKKKPALTFVDNDQRTMYDLVNNAILIQNCCSLAGVLHSFSHDLQRLRALLGDASNAVEQHPIAVMYASRVAVLSGAGCLQQTHDAYVWCCDNAQQLEPMPVVSQVQY